jgi:hypothetical protein
MGCTQLPTQHGAKSRVSSVVESKVFLISADLKSMGEFQEGVKFFQVKFFQADLRLRENREQRFPLLSHREQSFSCHV